MSSKKSSDQAQACSVVPNGVINTDDYFLVPKPVLSRQGAPMKELPPSSKDLKEEDRKSKDVATLPDPKMMTVTAIRGVLHGSGKRLASLRTRFIVRHSSTSGAGAALNAVVTLNPMATPEQSGIALLFDEFKVHGFKHAWSVRSNISTLIEFADCAVAYDPVNSGTYGSVAAALEANQHDGPYQVSNMQQGASFGTAPLGLTKGGFWVKDYIVPPSIAVNPGSSTEVIGQQWCSVSDTNATVGYLKPYIEPTSTGGTTVFQGYIEYDVTLRSRS